MAKNSLLDLGYKIDLVAPEGFFMLTKIQGVKKDIRQYDFRIVVLVEDQWKSLLLPKEKSLNVIPRLALAVRI